ncbi:MAG: bifunctional UDP-N-acetylglucosamine diphosphorylase/glucosamine-1-phosphate N-acetyltransferase GlmU [Elusimicrobiales bacterium]|nr:bifunctional UDP-N-acetylglucosamine diphosphorylase/glucosamine-1-phosphate N-acetyltransferase GlmU [Elusimicrobiales bacterium]
MEKTFLVLAAGLGTRMKSNLPKVLHSFDNKPIIYNILNKLKDINSFDIKVVVGHKKELVIDSINEWGNINNIKVEFIEQKVLKGSGEAVIESLDSIRRYETVVILSGDVPLIKRNTLVKMIRDFEHKKADVVLLTAFLDDPSNYGRIIRDKRGRITAITEESELSDEEHSIREINSGIYIFNVKKLSAALRCIKPKGPKREIFLTDVVNEIYKKGGVISSVSVKDSDEVYGPNSKEALVDLEKRYYVKNAKEHLENGVIIKSMDLTWISEDVKIGRDSVIYPNTYIYGKTVIGENCVIGPDVIIEDSVINDNSNIKAFCVISDSVVGENASVGPFSHIRPQSNIGQSAKIGNFCEIKKSNIGARSKVQHLSYIGDTEMGSDVNIGAGTITCNYDGIKKNKTVIADGAFIGSNTNLVAPINVGKNSLIGAGSTITDDVPDNALAIARTRQIIKEKKR